MKTTLIVGNRGAGRTTLLCKMLSDLSKEYGRPTLLLTDYYEECDRIDRALVAAGQFGVITKPVSALNEQMGKEWAAVGVDGEGAPDVIFNLRVNEWLLVKDAPTPIQVVELEALS